MQLTGKQIIERGIIKNYDEEHAIQQQGIDVRLNWIRPVTGGGRIAEKTSLSLPCQELAPDGSGMYNLAPGYYEVGLMEGADIPDNVSLHFKTRSSLVRCGSIVHSGQFDAGFHTQNAGCFLHVILPISIKRGARIAQAICFESDVVDNLYNGQFQADKQREGQR